MSAETDAKESQDLDAVAAGSSSLSAFGPYGMLAALLINGGIYGYKAYKQKEQANELSKHKRPEYDIPPAIREAVNNARLQAANPDLPGQSLMEQRLKSGTSTGIADLKNVSNNPNDLASNVARLYRAQQDQQNNLNIAGAQNYQANQGMLRNALGTLGQYQDKKWDYNQFQPYVNDKAAEAALREGSFRNTALAAQTIGAGFSGLSNYYQARNMQNNLYGNSDTVTAYRKPTLTGGAPSDEEMRMIKRNMNGGMTGAINGVPEPYIAPRNQQDTYRQMLMFNKLPKSDFNSPDFHDYNYK